MLLPSAPRHQARDSQTKVLLSLCFCMCRAKLSLMALFELLISLAHP